MTDLEGIKIRQMIEGMDREQTEEMVTWIDDEFLFAEIERRYGVMKDKLQNVGAVLGGHAIE